MFHQSTQLKGRTAAAFTILGILMGGLLASSFAGVPFNIPALGQGAAISVEVSAYGVAICGEETTHRVFAEWNVTGASSPTVDITLTLPNGQTLQRSRNTQQGQVSFDNFRLPDGGQLNVEVRASSGGATASASTTVSVSSCEGDGEPGPGKPGEPGDTPPGIMSSDLLCYNIEAVNPSRGPLAGQGETVRLISPQFGVVQVIIQNPEQLCVPVFKEQDTGVDVPPM